MAGCFGVSQALVPFRLSSVGPVLRLGMAALFAVWVPSQWALGWIWFSTHLDPLFLDFVKMRLLVDSVTQYLRQVWIYWLPILAILFFIEAQLTHTVTFSFRCAAQWFHSKCYMCSQMELLPVTTWHYYNTIDCIPHCMLFIPMTCYSIAGSLCLPFPFTHFAYPSSPPPPVCVLYLPAYFCLFFRLHI